MSPADRSARLFERAQTLMPGGVSSPVRSFARVGGCPRYIQSARGCRMADVDGRSYIDYVGSWGPMILGHCHPRVVEAVQRAAACGTSFGTCNPLEVELASEIITRMPAIEKLRFVNSGTEAVMSALRLARAATGRDFIIAFEGGYHGHVDALLARAGSGVATFAVPGSPGVPAAVTAATLLAPYNDLSAVNHLVAVHGEKVAAIIVEPIAGNMGVVLPRAGFLEGLSRAAQSCGALLIFDEVMTGFRVARGGAQQLTGIRPDITTMGKIIGGGLPVGAYGASAALMDRISPAGPVYQAGTLSGNPLAMAAGLETLRLLDDQAYQSLEATSAALADGLRAELEDARTPAIVQRAGSMFTVFFGTRDPVRNFADAASADHDQFAAFFQRMLERGVHLPPSGYEAWFVSLAHDSAAIEQTLETTRLCLKTPLGCDR